MMATDKTTTEPTELSERRDATVGGTEPTQQTAKQAEQGHLLAVKHATDTEPTTPVTGVATMEKLISTSPPITRHTEAGETKLTRTVFIVVLVDYRPTTAKPTSEREVFATDSPTVAVTTTAEGLTTPTRAPTKAKTTAISPNVTTAAGNSDYKTTLAS